MLTDMWAMFRRLVKSGNALADSFDQANTNFRANLGLDREPEPAEALEEKANGRKRIAQK